MTEYLTEQEQIEQLKKWLKVYGMPAFIGLLVGIFLFYSWHYYQDYRLRILTHASKVYDEMLTSRAQHNLEATHIQAEKLLSHYPSTPYGALAALMLAQELVDQKNYSEALQKLNWALDHAHEASIRQIARLRIARIYLANERPADALALLKKTDNASFLGLINEVRGDAYLLLHQNQNALDAYKQALQELPHADEMRPLLQMKLENLT